MVMNIQEILADRSVWTSDFMEATAHLGAHVAEPFLTTVNLVTIHQMTRAAKIGLVTAWQEDPGLAEDLGASWAWSLEDRHYLVRALRLERERHLGLNYFPFEVDGIRSLIAAAEAASHGHRHVHPVFVLYTSFTGPEHRMSEGCLFIDARRMQDFLFNRNRLTLHPAIVTLEEARHAGARPWYEMFPLK